MSAVPCLNTHALHVHWPDLRHIYQSTKISIPGAGFKPGRHSAELTIPGGDGPGIYIHSIICVNCICMWYRLSLENTNISTEEDLKQISVFVYGVCFVLVYNMKLSFLFLFSTFIKDFCIVSWKANFKNHKNWTVGILYFYSSVVYLSVHVVLVI